MKRGTIRSRLKTLLVVLFICSLGYLVVTGCMDNETTSNVPDDNTPASADACDPNPCIELNKSVCADNNGVALCTCDQGYIEDQDGNCISSPYSGGFILTASQTDNFGCGVTEFFDRASIRIENNLMTFTSEISESTLMTDFVMTVDWDDLEHRAALLTGVTDFSDWVSDPDLCDYQYRVSAVDIVFSDEDHFSGTLQVDFNFDPSDTSCGILTCFARFALTGTR